MRITTLALIGTAFAAAGIVTFTHFETRASERALIALATHNNETRQVASFVTDPIKPADHALFDKDLVEPIRAVDW